MSFRVYITFWIFIWKADGRFFGAGSGKRIKELDEKRILSKLEVLDVRLIERGNEDGLCEG